MCVVTLKLLLKADSFQRFENVIISNKQLESEWFYTHARTRVCAMALQWLVIPAELILLPLQIVISSNPAGVVLMKPYEM